MDGQTRVAEFFAGVGGFRAAFEHLPSFKFVFVNDCDKQCKLTYDANFEEPKMTVSDIRNIVPSELPDFDMMIGGFPCQSFSSIGHRKGEGDERGKLFYELLKIIDVKKPRMLLFENVKGLVFMEKGAVFRRMVDELESRGFCVQYKVLDTCVHSHVPQHRERVFIVASQDGILDGFLFPEPVAGGPHHVSQFLETPCDVIPRFIYTPDKQPVSYSIIHDAMIANDAPLYHFHLLWSCTKLRRKRLGCCPTLLAGMNRGGHSIPIFYDGQNIRCLSPRECFMLQGFPKTFILPSTVSRSGQYKQAGNAVTMALAQRIADAIHKTNKCPL